jgi:hypothetical protein
MVREDEVLCLNGRLSTSLKIGIRQTGIQRRLAMLLSVRAFCVNRHQNITSSWRDRLKKAAMQGGKAASETLLAC